MAVGPNPWTIWKCGLVLEHTLKSREYYQRLFSDLAPMWKGVKAIFFACGSNMIRDELIASIPKAGKDDDYCVPYFMEAEELFQRRQEALVLNVICPGRKYQEKEFIRAGDFINKTGEQPPQNLRLDDNSDVRLDRV